eukprot:gene12320-12456_t
MDARQRQQQQSRQDLIEHAIGKGSAITAGAAAEASDSRAAVQDRPVAVGYKYSEVVRKKADRELLSAYECEACMKFYGALQSWAGAGGGGEGSDAAAGAGCAAGAAVPVRPSCGHVAPGAPGCTAAGVVLPPAGFAGCGGAGASGGGGGAGGGGGGGPGQLDRRQLVQDAGRHRARFQPPSTPAGFWNIGFGDSMETQV